MEEDGQASRRVRGPEAEAEGADVDLQKSSCLTIRAVTGATTWDWVIDLDTQIRSPSPLIRGRASCPRSSATARRASTVNLMPELELLGP